MSTLDSLFDSKTTPSCEDTNGGSGNSAKLLKPFTFNCVHQPAFVADSENFLVFENFYYVSSALGMGKATQANDKSKEVKETSNEDSKKEVEKVKEVKKEVENEKEVKKEEGKEGKVIRNLEDGQFPLMTTPLGFKEAADTFCATNWKDVQTSYPKDEQPKDTVIKLCFGASFAFEFLTKGLYTHTYQYIFSIASITLSTHQSSMYHIYISYQYRPINTSYHCILSIYPKINTPYQYSLSKNPRGVILHS